MDNLLIMGNWKLNGNKRTIEQRTKILCDKLQNIKCNVVIFPPVIYLDMVRYYTSKNKKILLGAQNIDIHISGPFTGEISAAMLKDFGVKYVIVGHSERRIFHKESNDIITKKFSILKELELVPVLCIGENEEENKNGKTKEVCICQIDAILTHLSITAFKDSIIAYEPIWAIGTGKPVEPKKIQKIHKFIRNYLSEYNSEIAKNINIQYGGSVNEKNSTELISQPDINGLFIGNASLNPEIFSKIVISAVRAKFPTSI